MERTVEVREVARLSVSPFNFRFPFSIPVRNGRLVAIFRYENSMRALMRCVHWEASSYHSGTNRPCSVPGSDSREVELGAMDLFMDLTSATLDSLTPHATESKGVWQSV